MLASCCNCDANLTSGGSFWSPARICPNICDINCENTSGCCPAGAAGVAGAAVVVVGLPEVGAVVLEDDAAAAAAAVRLGGSDGRPIELKTSGAAVRRRSIPLWMSMMAWRASGLAINCCTLGFCIC